MSLFHTQPSSRYHKTRFHLLLPSTWSVVGHQSVSASSCCHHHLLASFCCCRHVLGFLFSSSSCLGFLLLSSPWSLVSCSCRRVVFLSRIRRVVPTSTICLFLSHVFVFPALHLFTFINHVMSFCLLSYISSVFSLLYHVMSFSLLSSISCHVFLSSLLCIMSCLLVFSLVYHVMSSCLLSYITYHVFVSYLLCIISCRCLFLFIMSFLLCHFPWTFPSLSRLSLACKLC